MASSVAPRWIKLKWVDNSQRSESWIDVGKSEDGEQQRSQVCRIFDVCLTEGVFRKIQEEMAEALRIWTLPPTMTVGWIGSEYNNNRLIIIKGMYPIFRQQGGNNSNVQRP